MGTAARARDAHVEELVRSHRFDEALRDLYEARDAAPDDVAIATAIRSVRDRQLRHGLERLGSLDGVPRRTGAHASGTSADAQYVVGLISDRATIEELLDGSTLGRHRTVGALIELLDHDAIALARSERVAGASPVAAITERTVIVADGNGSQATLTRTMLRLALGAGARMITVASASGLVSAVEKHRADLLVVELTLPGSDGLAAMRAVRKAAGAPVDTIIVAQRIEIAYVEARLPERAVVLARPIERSSLLESLEALGVAGARGRG